MPADSALQTPPVMVHRAAVMRVETASRSDLGMKRELNEDGSLARSPVTDPLDNISAVLAVADGMGGHDAGDVASKIACDFIEHLFVRGGYPAFARECGVRSDDYATLVGECLKAIHGRISERAKSFNSRRTMGSTCVAGLIVNGGPTGLMLLVGGVGDSRCYVVRRNAIVLATEDDSVVWELYRNGKIKYGDIRSHPRRNVLTQALGSSASVNPKSYKVSLQPGDIVVLCTDGLHGMISDKEIRRIVSTSERPEQAAAALVEAANGSGGKDNVSVAVAFTGSNHATRLMNGPHRKAAAMTTLLFGAAVAGAVFLNGSGNTSPAVEHPAYSIVVHDLPGPLVRDSLAELTFELQPRLHFERGSTSLHLASFMVGHAPDTIALESIADRHRRVFRLPIRMATAGMHKIKLVLLDPTGLQLNSSMVFLEVREPARPAPSKPGTTEPPEVQPRLFRLTEGVDRKIQVWLAREAVADQLVRVEIVAQGKQETVLLARRNRVYPVATGLDYQQGDRVLLKVNSTPDYVSYRLP